MKHKHLSFLSCLLVFGGVTASGQEVDLTFDLIGLYDSSGDPIANGSFGVVVADTSGDGFLGDYLTGSADFSVFSGTSLTYGSAIGGSSDDIIIGALTASDYFGYQSLRGSQGINFTASLNTGDNLAMYWFPAVSSSSISGAVSEYGFFRTATAESGTGTIGFVLPSAGTWTLAASLQAVGGNVAVSDFTAVAVPEPSMYAAMLGALALGFVAYRRRNA